MGSVGNPNPWAPYDTYKDCSQGICSIYCPQWCYIIFPPPPPSFFGNDDEGSSTDFSPLLIALIGILASAFILVSYYTVISKFCRRRGQTAGDLGPNLDQSMVGSWQGNANPTAGLDEALIKSITVYKYTKNDGFVDCTDCSVCLSEFKENESLRLLPKCNHAFHVPCIDTWLKSHSNCPLCRADIAAASITSPGAAATSAIVANQPVPEASITARANRNTGINAPTLEYQQRSDDSVHVIQDLETGARDEAVVSVSASDADGSSPKHSETQPIRRSVSLNSSMCQGAISIADILLEIEDDDEKSVGVGSSRLREEGREMGKTMNERNGVSSFLIRSSLVMKRSVSTGRFIFMRYDRGRNLTLPN